MTKHLSSFCLVVTPATGICTTQISTSNFARIRKTSNFAQKRLFRKRKDEVEIFVLFLGKIRRIREEKKLLQREVPAVLDVDTLLYGKIRRGDEMKNENLSQFSKPSSILRKQEFFCAMAFGCSIFSYC